MPAISATAPVVNLRAAAAAAAAALACVDVAAIPVASLLTHQPCKGMPECPRSHSLTHIHARTCLHRPEETLENMSIWKLDPEDNLGVKTSFNHSPFVVYFKSHKVKS